MIRSLTLLSLLLLLGCDGFTSRGEPAESEHEGEDEHGHADGESDERVVHLSPAAITTNDIEVGAVEERALSGGAGLPAELSFDPLSVAHVSPLASGRFISVEVELGQRVTPGMLLAVVASETASEASSRLTEARAQLTAAETALARQRQLVGEGIGAHSALVDAEAVVAGLRARSTGLSRQLGVLGSGRSGQLRLVAPIEGVVIQLHATPGETSSTDEPAFTIANPDAISVYVQVPELAIGTVRLGQRALFRPHAFPDLALPGVVNYIAPTIDPDTRSLSMRVALDAMTPNLLSGMYGSLEIVGDQRRSLAVPCNAVVTLGGATQAFVPGDAEGEFRPVAVRVGRRAGAYCELLEGLETGDPVVTRGAFTLKSALSQGELAEHEH
ncbi:MAG: efflux RND transporter periplasmic adaptor subunit [Sandaracinaceae bacterium]|nr:efflux RND transporter periplasmic adaptor subunit [Sandaracinaceae bacterium]